VVSLLPLARQQRFSSLPAFRHQPPSLLLARPLQWPRPHQQRGPLLSSPAGMPTQFPEYSLWYLTSESPDSKITTLDGCLRFPWGSDREDDTVRVAAVEHDMEFFPSGTRNCRGARIVLTLDDGRVKRYSVRTLLPCYLGQGGGYGDPVRWHGSYRGKLVVEGDKFDLTDEETLNRLGYTGEYFSEWRCDDGEVGYGQFEYVLAASQRYGFPLPLF